MTTFIACFALVAGLLFGQADTAHRRPLDHGAPLLMPEGLAEEYDETERRIVRFDAAYSTREVDPESGRIEIAWTTRSGQRKSFVYQRLDAIELSVEVTVERLPSGIYRYTYVLGNSAASRLPLTGFVVQNFASDARAVKKPELFAGEMSSDVPGFAKGKWVLYGKSYFGDTVVPGSRARAVIESASPPGVVGCRAYGGEIFGRYPDDTPTAVQDAIGRQYYGLWCTGITIGPVASVGRMRTGEKRAYLLDQLPRMRAAGWITSEAEAWYTEHFGRTKEPLARQLRSDLADGQITSEFALIVGEVP